MKICSVLSIRATLALCFAFKWESVLASLFLAPTSGRECRLSVKVGERLAGEEGDFVGEYRGLIGVKSLSLSRMV